MQMVYSVSRKSKVIEVASGHVELTILLHDLGLTAKEIERGLAKLPTKGKFTSKGVVVNIVNMRCRPSTRLEFKYGTRRHTGHPYDILHRWEYPSLQFFEYLCRLNAVRPLEKGDAYYIPVLDSEIEILCFKA